MNPGTSPSDSALISKAHEGDSDAREELAQQVSESAYVFALQLTRSPEAARDIAQDSLLRFFRHLDRFDMERPLEPWLFGIVRNQVRDTARRERVRRHESLDAWLEQGRPEPTGKDDPVAAAEHNELQQRVWRAISELGDSHREVLVLRDYHGLSYSELAEVLSIPKGTVMSRLHSSRQRLRRILIEQEARLQRTEETPRSDR